VEAADAVGVMRAVPELRRSLAGERQLALLLSARLISLLGTGIAPIAVAFAALQLTGSSSAVAVVVGARMFAQVTLMLLGGVFADRVSRQRVMVMAELTAGVVQAISAALLIAGVASLWELALLQAAGGAAAAFLLPALQGVVPELVAEERRHQANALLGLVRDVGRLSGVAVGGVIVALVGGGWGLAVDAATFFAGALLIAQLRLPQSEPVPQQRLIRDLADGWDEFRSHTWVWALTAQSSVVNAFGMGAFLVLGPVVARDDFSGAASWAVIFGGFTVGLIAGGVLAARIKVTRPLLLAPLAGLLLMPPLLLLAFHAPIAVTTVSTATLGVATSLYGANFATVLQAGISLEKLSRVSAYTMFGSFAAIPLGVAAIGALTAVAGVAPTLLVCAFVVGVASAALYAFSQALNLRTLVVAIAAPAD
jgi:MFS family permease